MSTTAEIPPGAATVRNPDGTVSVYIGGALAYVTPSPVHVLLDLTPKPPPPPPPASSDLTTDV